MPLYFKLLLVDHPLKNCQPYECETGHNTLSGIFIDILTYQITYNYMMPKLNGYKGNLRRFETKPPILSILFEKYSILDYGHKWMLKGWNNIYICKLSLCVLLQDDQSTEWSSMENQIEDHTGDTHI